MEENLAFNKSSKKDATFDVIVGHIEDIVVDDIFQKMQTSFMDKYYKEFDDNEENKLSYTPIFNEYVNMLEKHIETALQKRLPKFNMNEFMSELSRKTDEISEELNEMLLSFTDFLIFKQLMLDHKDFREGRVADFSFDLTVTPLSNKQAENR